MTDVVQKSRCSLSARHGQRTKTLEQCGCRRTAARKGLATKRPCGSASGSGRPGGFLGVRGRRATATAEAKTETAIGEAEDVVGHGKTPRGKSQLEALYEAAASNDAPQRFYRAFPCASRAVMNKLEQSRRSQYRLACHSLARPVSLIRPARVH